MPIAAATPGVLARTKGFVASSSATVVGTVGSPCATLFSISASRALSASLCGSAVTANRALESVYSWPLKTFVSGGSAAIFESDDHMSAGVPSNRRPQPSVNIVSPANARPDFSM